MPCPFLENSWRHMCGIQEKDHSTRPSLEELRKSEWSQDFEDLRRNRMVMGAFRYGLMKDQDFNKFDFPVEIDRRMEKYREDGNLEHLVDAGNIIMLEFVKAQRNGRQVIPVDDGVHSIERGKR